MRKMTVLFFSLCFVVSAFAATPADQLQKKLSQFTTLRANFEERVISEEGQVLQTTKGEMAIARPGKFYWHILAPLSQTIVARDNRVWILQNDLQQVIIRRLENSVSSTPVILLTQPHAYLSDQFVIRETRPDVFSLTPKKSDEVFTQIILRFDGDYLHTMQMQNALQQSTLIYFSDVKINARIPGSQFQLTIPKGFDVIDQAHLPSRVSS